MVAKPPGRQTKQAQPLERGRKETLLTSVIHGGCSGAVLGAGLISADSPIAPAVHSEPGPVLEGRIMHLTPRANDDMGGIS